MKPTIEDMVSGIYWKHWGNRVGSQPIHAHLIQPEIINRALPEIIAILQQGLREFCAKQGKGLEVIESGEWHQYHHVLVSEQLSSNHGDKLEPRSPEIYESVWVRTIDLTASAFMKQYPSLTQDHPVRLLGQNRQWYVVARRSFHEDGTCIATNFIERRYAFGILKALTEHNKAML